MPPARTIEVVANAADLFHTAAEEFVRVGRTAIGAQGRFTVALSGGSTPKALYSLLATNYTSFAWNRTFLFFGDERHVRYRSVAAQQLEGAVRGWNRHRQATVVGRQVREPHVRVEGEIV